MGSDAARALSNLIEGADADIKTVQTTIDQHPPDSSDQLLILREIQDMFRANKKTLTAALQEFI
jgi:hypothetical protein